MRTILSIVAVLLIPWLAHGQFLIDPYRFAPNYDSLLPPGMKHRWRASDLSSSPVATWTDSISGWNWTQTTEADKPTWSASGVRFDGTSDFLTVTNLPSHTVSNSWLVVFNFDTLANSKPVIVEAYSGSNILIAQDTAGYLYENSGSTALGLLTTNTFDFLACRTTNVVAYRAYTNGISGFSAVSGWNDGVDIALVGKGGSFFYKGEIKEVIVWSNAVFTASQIADIHTYVTNVYGITP